MRVSKTGPDNGIRCVCPSVSTVYTHMTVTSMVLNEWLSGSMNSPAKYFFKYSRHVPQLIVSG